LFLAGSCPVSWTNVQATRSGAGAIVSDRMRLVLASASPRRAELLRAAGFTFDTTPAAIDEALHFGEPPSAYTLRLAREKAAIASTRHPDCAILAADTIVVAADQILGKPAGSADATRMLQLLSGAEHVVQTGVVLRANGRELSDLASTRVRFCMLTAEEISWYVGTGEPIGKAGAYAIQGRAARFVNWIEGSWSNVVGLPLATVYRMLKEAGVT
jgi:septum formation protein